jgi:hypothetical protein
MVYKNIYKITMGMAVVVAIFGCLFLFPIAQKMSGSRCPKLIKFNIYAGLFASTKTSSPSPLFNFLKRWQ